MCELIVLVCGIVALGQVAPAADPLADNVRQLVRQLNATQLAERDAAEQALSKLGVPVIALLPVPNDRMPAEVIERIARVRQTILRESANVSGKASLITLKATDMPLSQIVAELGKQSGNRVIDYRPQFGEEVTDTKLTVDFNKIPFWQALDTVLDQAGLTIYGYANQSGIALVNRPSGVLPRSGHGSISGPFRVDAARFEIIKDLHNPRSESLKLFIDVAWEPRLKPILISQPLDAITALNPQHAAIPIDGKAGESEATTNDGNSTVELQIPLTLPPRSVTKIASLKGRLKALVPGPVETFRFDRLPIVQNGKATKVEIRKAGVTVTLDQVRKNGDVWGVQMRVRFEDPAQALESHRAWYFSNPVYLVGADKKQITPGGYEQTRQTKEEFGLLYLFDLEKGPENLAFVYETPIAILELPIEYELHDLELP